MNDIWHITNQNENLTDIPEKGNFIILDGSLCNSGTWYDGEGQIIFWENVKRWCYLDDLIKENERTRKALDKAKDKLDTIRQYYRGTAIIYPDDIAEYCNNALDQIKQITEQRGELK